MAVTTVALLATMMTTKATMRMSRRSGADDGRNVLLADHGAAALPKSCSGEHFEEIELVGFCLGERRTLLADPGAAAQAGFPENREAAEKAALPARRACSVTPDTETFAGAQLCRRGAHPQ